MLKITTQNQDYEIATENDSYLLNGQPVMLDIARQEGGLLSVLVDGKSYTAYVRELNRAEKRISLTVNGQNFDLTLAEPIDLLLEQLGLQGASAKKAETVKAPMPGLVLSILVQEGQEVSKGDPLLVLEAMKMENVIKAGADGKVKSIHVAPRTAVEKGIVMIAME